MVVYFIKSDKFIKIGKAASVLERVRQLQTASPHPIEVLKQTESMGGKEATELEREIHRKFDKYSSGGEWFHYCKEIQDYIEGMPDVKPEKTRVPFSTSMPPELMTLLRMEAARMGKKVNELLEEAIMAYLAPINKTVWPVAFPVSPSRKQEAQALFGTGEIETIPVGASFNEAVVAVSTPQGRNEELKKEFISVVDSPAIAAKVALDKKKDKGEAVKSFFKESDKKGGKK